MTGMQVLFLAVGSIRRNALSMETAAVTGVAARRMVVIDSAGARKGPKLPEGVEAIDIARLDPLMRIEQLLLYRGPGFLASLLRRGPLRRPVRRMWRAYERRVTRWVHRELFVPLYRKWIFRTGPRLVERKVLPRVSPDLVVVMDLNSIPVAVRVLDRYAARGEPAPEVAYSVQYAGLDLSASAG